MRNNRKFIVLPGGILKRISGKIGGESGGRNCIAQREYNEAGKRKFDKSLNAEARCENRLTAEPSCNEANPFDFVRRDVPLVAASCGGKEIIMYQQDGSKLRIAV